MIFSDILGTDRSGVARWSALCERVQRWPREGNEFCRRRAEYVHRVCRRRRRGASSGLLLWQSYRQWTWYTTVTHFDVENACIHCNYLIITHTSQTKISSLICCIRTHTRHTSQLLYNDVCNLLTHLLTAQSTMLVMTLTLYINVLYSTAYLNSSFCYGMRSVTS